MTVFLDTNILLDYFDEKRIYHDAAKKIVSMCYNRAINGTAASLSFTNIFYILRKEYTAEERKKLLRILKSFIEVVGVTGEIIEKALDNEYFDDLEDCVQYECAKVVGAEYIITRNIKDFKENDVACIEPKDFIEILTKQ